MAGTFIVNRFDYIPDPGADNGKGVSAELLDLGANETGVAKMVCDVALGRYRRHGAGVTIIDGGANLGFLTVVWGRFMCGAGPKPWGQVFAFEPQKYVFCSLAGNVVLNNCFNVTPVRAALDDHDHAINVPFYPPNRAFNFGGVHLDGTDKTEGDEVDAIAIDSLALRRLDVLKLDVEGMEMEALIGAADTIKRCRPVIIAETWITGVEKIRAALPLDYQVYTLPNLINCIAFHKDEGLGGALIEQINAWQDKKSAA